MDVSSSLVKEKYFSTPSIGKILEGKFSGGLNASLDENILWGANSYGLENSKLFEALSEEQKLSLLNELAFKRLEEAYHIEHYGMTFASKMSLFSKSFQEQQLYCVVASEEASHLQMVKTLIGSRSKDIEINDFSKFLKDIIAVGDRETLIFVIQILLEGWGLDHYKIMADTAIDNDVKDVFSQIVIDESAHHGSGLVLFEESQLSNNQINKISEIMNVFLETIKVGPTGLLNSFESVAGEFISSSKSQFLTEINAQEEIQRKLNLVKKLMLHAKAHKIIDRLNFN